MVYPALPLCREVSIVDRAFVLGRSVYHWAGQLVPPHLAPIAAYVTGWFNFLGASVCRSMPI